MMYAGIGNALPSAFVTISTAKSFSYLLLHIDAQTETPQLMQQYVE
jgi:hypothetical protein